MIQHSIWRRVPQASSASQYNNASVVPDKIYYQSTNCSHARLSSAMQLSDVQTACMPQEPLSLAHAQCSAASHCRHAMHCPATPMLCNKAMLTTPYPALCYHTRDGQPLRTNLSLNTSAWHAHSVALHGVHPQSIHWAAEALVCLCVAAHSVALHPIAGKPCTAQKHPCYEVGPCLTTPYPAFCSQPADVQHLTDYPSTLSLACAQCSAA